MKESEGDALPIYKENLTRPRRFLRLVLGVLDPRAWLHMAKMANYYNYTHVQPLRQMTLGQEVRISPDASFANAERIRVGNRVNIGSRCHIWAGPGTATITIGDDVLFGPEVMMTAATYLFNEGSPISQQPMREADIVIGKDVWLATRAIILPGARIGDGAIIGAGAVVKGEVLPGQIVAGSPARPVSQRILPLA